MSFSESEAMTIKRLEVALRKKDFGLLKDGTYKLHEKFHLGHKFEYKPQLQQILDYIEKKDIPPEINDILKSTIIEILAQDSDNQALEESPEVSDVQYENLDNLDELIKKMDESGYEMPAAAANEPQTVSQVQIPVAAQDAPKQEPDSNEQTVISDEPDISYEPEVQEQEAIQEQGCAQQSLLDETLLQDVEIDLSKIEDLPDFSFGDEDEQTPSAQELQLKEPAANTSSEPSYTPSQISPKTSQYIVRPTEPVTEIRTEQQARPVSQQQPQLQQQLPEPPPLQSAYAYNTQQSRPIPVSIKQEASESNGLPLEITVFYDDAHCEIDFSKIKDYRNHLNTLFSKRQKCSEEYNLLKHIADITNIVDTSIHDVERILSTLSTTKNKMSFLTTSQSQNIAKAFYTGKLDFEIPFVKKAQNPETAYSLIPMLGLSNIFVCAECNARTLKTDFNTKTLSVQCPECDGACFPDLYAVNSYNPDCNPIFWHRAFAALVRSKIWIIVNPPLDENKEVVFDFIKTAYRAATPEKIYLLTSENDKREFYKQTFTSINPSCDLRFDYATQEKLCEDFINREIMLKVYG